MTIRSLGWAGLLCALTSLATSSGCGGQATSLGQGPSKCEPNTKCAFDAGEPPMCGPGMAWNGSRCVAIVSVSSTGGQPNSGGSPAMGGRAGTSGAASTDAGPGSGGVSTGPDAGDAGLDADMTPPVFEGCKLVYDVSYETFRVSWDPAADDSTTSSKLVYEIWVRPLGSTGDPRSVAPTATVVGTTFVDVEGLLPGTEYEVLCGVMDESGNRDSGGRLSSAKTLVDGVPPTFGGVGAGSGMSRHTTALSWIAATDNATASSRIIYAIYESDVAGGEDFATPLLITDPGATSVTIEGLTYATHYFVVRARDRAGNEEQNTSEVQVAPKTSFAIDVQPIFTESCAVQICHTVGVDGTNPPIQGLNLEEGAAYTNIVNVVARQGIQISPPEPNIKRIDGTSTNPMDSYLWRKIQKPALPNIYGSTDPPTYSPRMLTSEEIQIITDWITEGSLNN
jgi:chitodextrinase